MHSNFLTKFKLLFFKKHLQNTLLKRVVLAYNMEYFTKKNGIKKYVESSSTLFTYSDQLVSFSIKNLFMNIFKKLVFFNSKWLETIDTFLECSE